MRWPTFGRGPTFAEYSAEYLKTARPRLSRTTYGPREAMLRHHVLPRLGPMRLRAIRRADIRALIATLLTEGFAPATVRHVLAVVKAMLAEAERDGVLEANPAAGSWREYKLRQSLSPRHLTEDQLRSLTGAVECSGPPWTVLIGLIWRTGLRRGEALALRWPNVDLDGRTIYVHDTLYQDRTLAGRTKTGRDRTVDLSRAAVALLTRHRAWTQAEGLRLGLGWPEWVFWGPRGGPIIPTHLNARFQGWRRAANLPRQIRIHDLRHTYAVRLLETGARERYAQDQLGHASITITSDLYAVGAKLDDRRFLEAIELGAEGTGRE